MSEFIRITERLLVRADCIIALEMNGAETLIRASHIPMPLKTSLSIDEVLQRIKYSDNASTISTEGASWAMEYTAPEMPKTPDWWCLECSAPRFPSNACGMCQHEALK